METKKKGSRYEKGSRYGAARRPKLRLGWAALVAAVLMATIAVPMVASTQKGEAIVQATAIKLRMAPAVDADVVTTLVKGTRVTVYETSGEWLLVSYSGYKGYVMRPYMNVVKAPGLEGAASALSGGAPLGQRILDTPGAGSNSGTGSSASNGAISGANSEASDGANSGATNGTNANSGTSNDTNSGVNSGTSNGANSGKNSGTSNGANSAASSGTSNGANSGAATGLTVGKSGQDVIVIQAALKSIGLFSGDITGYFGSATRNALMAYQRNAGSSPTGVCDDGTYRLLKSVYDATNGKTVSISNTTDSRGATAQAQPQGTAIPNANGRAAETPTSAPKPTDAPKATATPGATPLVQTPKPTATPLIQSPTAKPTAAKTAAPTDAPVSRSSKVELVDWWTSDIQKVIPRGAVFKVTDVRTGRTFTAYRRAGTNHSDTEPYTAEDTATLKAIYGGAWSWARRAIWVTAGGRTFAASMNGMPHGDWNIKTNNFDGHICIHFVNSRTHGTDRVDPDHQKAIQEAYQKGN